jgi:ribonuclease P protein component
VEKKHRLSRSADFQRVYRHGKSTAGRYAVLYYFERLTEAADSGGEPRLGVSVSKKVGGAVVRNHVKRVLKEVFRARQDIIAPNYDYVIIARPGLAEYMEKSQHEEVAAMIADLFQRANLVQEAD